METKLNIDLKTLLLIGLILVIGFGGGFAWLTKRFNEVSNQLETQQVLTEALQADLKYTKNALDEEVATKLSLQVSVKTLNEQNEVLSKNQKELLWRVKNVQNKNDLISAALVVTQTKIDSILYEGGDVEIGDDFVSFGKVTDSIDFNLTMNNVRPLEPYKQPSVMFNHLMVPNKQFIEFNWDDDTKYNQRPVSFSITNSNSMVKTIDADSYIIPEVNKNALKPTGWKKVGGWFDERKNEVIVGGVCIGVGTLLGLYLAQ